MQPSFLFLLSYFLVSNAQTISKTTPVPPLQWINLSGSLSGTSKPPPLKDASIGYDETSRTIIIFGGESEGGLPQSKTYLLNLDTLKWTIPSPPTGLERTPAARSLAVSGCDFAASNRHGFVIIGGKGTDGKAIDDVWEYDFNNQFWSPVGVSPGGPSPRWGAAGGIDTRTAPIQDSVVPGPNNTLYLAGGYDGTTASSLSDVWQLHLAGTLSSNLADSAVASWERWDHAAEDTLPPSLDFSSTVIGKDIVVAGGCNSAANPCGQTDASVIDVVSNSEVSIGGCSAPRRSPVMVPNVNTFSSTFTSQVFLLLGTSDANTWNDDGGLAKGEVTVLDKNAGSWARILPAGDPGQSGSPVFPSPREGAAAVSYQLALVGASRTTSSDTILFGGRDMAGNYFSEVWLLRAYSGIITSSNTKWSGYGDGTLQTGPNAAGAGVSMQYLSRCATPVTSTSSKPSATSSGTQPAQPTSTSSSPGTGVGQQSEIYNISSVHSSLSALSLALILPAFLLHQWATYPDNANARGRVAICISGATIAIAYAFGVGGLVMSFSSISASPPATSSTLTKRSASTGSNLKTAHGIVGLAFFLGLYGFLPILLLVVFWFRHRYQASDEPEPHKSEETEEQVSTAKEKSIGPGVVQTAPQSTHIPSRPASPRRRTQSWGPSSLWRNSHEGRLSSDSESNTSSAAPKRGFEVVNRPARRNPDGLWLGTPVGGSSRPITLGDIDWLHRRRSLNAVGELDYAITNALKAQQAASTPTTADALLTPPPVTPPTLRLLKSLEFVSHTAFQSLFLGLYVITLVALWNRAPRWAFALFLAWILILYFILLVAQWRARSSSVNPEPYDASSSPANAHHNRTEDHDLVSSQNQGPYAHHRPPYHASTSHGSNAMLAIHDIPRSAEDNDEDDEDDASRQSRIEDEMDRRNVSIVTVPRTKLWITNPS